MRFIDGVFFGVAVLSDSVDRTLEFQCPKCAKRLKASAKAAGKKFQCPACGQTVKVPGVAPVANKDDDWLNLDGPETSNSLPRPSQPAAEPVITKSTTPPKPKPAASSAEKTAPAPRSVPQAPKTATPAAPAASDTKRSIFDDDLPELAALEDVPPELPCLICLNVDLEELVPVKPKSAGKPNRPAQPSASAAAPASSSDGKKGDSPKKAAALDQPMHNIAALVRRATLPST